MIAASFWEAGGTYLTVLTPLVAVPLTVITFYLRSLNEQQVNWRGELLRRVERIDTAIVDMRTTINDFERDYTSKEEWLRECMHARRLFENLARSTTRLEALMPASLAASAKERSSD